jgi:hypothetical protein
MRQRSCGDRLPPRKANRQLGAGQVPVTQRRSGNAELCSSCFEVVLGVQQPDPGPCTSRYQQDEAEEDPANRAANEEAADQETWMTPTLLDV